MIIHACQDDHDPTSRLRQLEIRYGHDRNPLHALEAVWIALGAGIDLPDWAHDYLACALARILEIRDEVARDRKVKREADCVGKALGFGTRGPGPSGWFKRSTMLERDYKIYARLREELDKGT